MRQRRCVRSAGITKTGFGTLVLGGTTANTFTGDTTVNEGTLILDKGTGAGGVNAIAGRLVSSATTTRSRALPARISCG